MKGMLTREGSLDIKVHERKIKRIEEKGETGEEQDREKHERSCEWGRSMEVQIHERGVERGRVSGDKRT